MAVIPQTIQAPIKLFDQESSKNCPVYPGGCHFCGKNEGCHIGNQELLPCGAKK
jgi:hypothetical protein